MNGISYRQIAEQLNRSASTIMREVKRNTDDKGTYLALEAEHKYRCRRKKSKRRTRFYKNPALIKRIKDCLLKRISPEAIAYCYKKAQKGRKLSENTIRKAVKSGFFKDITPRRVFRRKGIKKHKGISATIQTTPEIEISNRKEKYSSRDIFGNWEADSVVGRNGTGIIVTLVERKSRLLVARYCSNKRANTVKLAIIDALQGLECKSITYDRGSEFASYREIEAVLKNKTFFADPHSPWQRGTNENTNRMLRAFYPKGSDFRDLAGENLQLLVSYINNTPRRLFNYSTSAKHARRHYARARDRPNEKTMEQIQPVSITKLIAPTND